MKKIIGNFEVRRYFMLINYFVMITVTLLSFFLCIKTYLNPYIILLICLIIIVVMAIPINLYGTVLIDRKRKVIIRRGIFLIHLRKISFDDVKNIKIIYNGTRDNCIYFIDEEKIDEQRINSIKIKSYIRVLYTDKIFEFIKDSFNDESIFNCNNEK